jgi:5-methylcytosine-specific restriction endonuclease McrA
MEDAMAGPTTTPPPTAPSPRPAPYRSPVPYGTELRVLVRDGYACRKCRLAVVADGARRVIRIRDDGGDSESNLVLLCSKCARQHDQHLDNLRRLGIGRGEGRPK